MLEIINKPNDFWENSSSKYKNTLYSNGYTLFSKDSDFLRIPYFNLKPRVGYVDGYVKILDVEPDSGATNIGDFLKNTEDSGLIELSNKYELYQFDESGNAIKFDWNTINKYITSQSTFLLQDNFIEKIDIVNYNQLITNVITNYNGNYFFRDMNGESDVKITKTKLLSFNGTNQDVTCGNVGTLQNYTIKIIFMSRGVENYRNIFDTNMDGSGDCLRLEQNSSNQLTIRSGNQGGNSGFVINGSIVEDTLYELIISFNGNQFFFNLNGEKNGWSPIYIANNFTNLFVGNGFGGSRIYKGEIASFTLWDNYRESDAWKVPTTEPIVDYLFKENIGDVIYNRISDSNHGLIRNYDDSMWDSTLDNIEQSLFITGYQAYENDLFPGNKSKYRFVPYVNGTKLNTTISGFTHKYDIEPNSGISDVGCLFSGIKLSDDDLDYEGIIQKINDIPPKEEFQVTKKDGVFTDWAALKQ